MADGPTFLIAGAPRCGTTSLHRYLDQHPDIHMSPVKEPHFFDAAWDEAETETETGTAGTGGEAAGTADAPDRVWQEYLDLFAGAGDAAAVGEATPDYLWHPKAADRIRRTLPEVRIVVLLRDPVERAHSHYLLRVRDRGETRAFPDFVRDEIEDWKRWRDGEAGTADAGSDRGGWGHSEGGHGEVVRMGLYGDHLARFLDAFGADRVRVHTFDALANEPRAVLEDLAGFLGVDPAPMADVDTSTAHHAFGVPRGPVSRWLRRSPTVRAVARRLLPRRVRRALGQRVLLKEADRPPLAPEAVRLLVPVYAPQVDRVEELLGRSLPELRRTWGRGDNS